MCFHQKASQQLQVGVELEINCRIQESTGAIAYQVDLPKADLIFRGMIEHVAASFRLFILSLIRLHSYTILFLRSFFRSFVCTFIFEAYFYYIHYIYCIIGTIDTNWTVGAVLEKKLQPLPFTFALSGMINHSKPQFRLGCGLIIG